MTHPRILAAALTVACLALAGSGLAEPLLQAHVGVHTPVADVEADAEVRMVDVVVPPKDNRSGDDRNDSKPPRNATFMLRVDPEHADAAPGDVVRFALVVDAKENRSVKLDVTYGTAGYNTTLSPSQLDVPAGGSANATLTVEVPEQGFVGWARFGLNATAADGERHEAAANVRTKNSTAPPSEPSFWMALTPAEQTAGPNETVEYTVVAHSDGPLTVRLAALAPVGFTVQLQPDVLHLRAGEKAYATLTVRTPDANWTTVYLHVNATADETGQTMGARAALHYDGASIPPPPPEDNSTRDAGNNSTSAPASAPASRPAPGPATAIALQSEDETGSTREEERSAQTTEARVEVSATVSPSRLRTP